MHEDPTPPPGWFVYRIKHEHTRVIYTHDTCQPARWTVQLQRYPKGGYMVTGHGTGLADAWSEAVDRANRVDIGMPENID